MSRISTLLVTAATLAASLPLPDAAAQQNAARSGGGAYSAILDNLDLMISSYTTMLARKYDLTEEQGEYTKRLLHEKAQAFLSRHDAEIRDLLDHMSEVRSGGPMEPGELIAWGQRVAPLFEEAKKVIVDGNDQWREILTEPQRHIHDEDLKLMYESFATTESQIQRIVSGEMTVDEFRSPPRPNRRPARVVNQQPQPRPITPGTPTPGNVPVADDGAVVEADPHGEELMTPEMAARAQARREAAARQEAEQAHAQQQGNLDGSAGRRAIGAARTPRSAVGDQAAAAGRNFETEWERYVREFIAKYKLDEGQTNAANGVLKDCQEQAARIMKSRVGQLEQIDKQIADLSKPAEKDRHDAEAAKQRTRQVADLNAQKLKLLDPIRQIFEQQLKPRLEKIPTRAQRKAVEDAAAAKPAAGKSAAAGKTDPKKPADKAGGKGDAPKPDNPQPPHPEPEKTEPEKPTPPEE